MDASNPSTPVEDPRLPPELERLIFELAAISRPTSIPKLMLISWRVKEWVEPLLYRVVLLAKKGTRMRGFPIFTVDRFLQAIAAKPPGFFNNAVKHLFLEVGKISEAETILSACNHVTNLFASRVLGLDTPALWALRDLRRLTVDLGMFLERYTLECVSATFRNITHLELLNFWDDDWRVEDLWARLALIPHLTHISFNCAPDLAGFYSALHTDKRLHYIVFLSLVPETHQLGSDDRFVFVSQETLYWQDWLLGAHRGKDYWTVAESFIAARRAGKVEPSVYRISDKDNWRSN
ncbi:hypothetical protein B0H19DRAFT_1265015 [Mycena capillaripes]|nr:hypothetical protein B0H19DRAFT_1265015 [Mycena capillaripes]